MKRAADGARVGQQAGTGTTDHQSKLVLYVFHAIYRKRKYGPERKFFTHNDAELHANWRRFVLTEHD
jgi:hypothetical protein